MRRRNSLRRSRNKVEFHQDDPSLFDPLKRVYVGKLPSDMSEDVLREHIGSAGKVLHICLRRERRGRPDLCAIVEFETPEQAAEAINSLQGRELQGSALVLSLGHLFKVEATTRCYVWSLSRSTKRADLEDHFRTAGEVVSARLMKDADGRSKGFGTVQFRTPEAVAEAVKVLHESELHGRTICVREDREECAKPARTRPKGSSSRGYYYGHAQRQAAAAWGMF